jgi:putative intracellular protease/amidase
LRDVRAADYAAVLFCGQNASEYTWGANAREANRLIDEARRERRVLGAICTGQGVLLWFNVLRDRTVAICPQIDQDKYSQAGVKPASSTVYTDDRLVTAANPEDARRFADAILAAIGK